MAAFFLVAMHDLADPIDAALAIAGLSVSKCASADVRPPRRSRTLPVSRRVVSWQTACCLCRVLHPHRDVEPVEDWWRRDRGIDQDRSRTGTAVGERSHFSVVGSADGSKISTNQRREVSVSLCDCAEHLPAAAYSFDVTDADPPVPCTLFAATDERRVHADSDRCCCGSRRLVLGRSSKLLADPQCMVAQCLRAPTSVNGPQVL